MADPIQVEVTRGSVVEAMHTVHAVAVRDGRIVAEAGDPRLLTFLRSSAKPIQALPLVRARPDLDDREIAIALKVEDGAFRAIRPALAAFLGNLGISTGELGLVMVENSHGETVGELRTGPQSHVPKGGSRR